MDGYSRGRRPSGLGERGVRLPSASTITPERSTTIRTVETEIEGQPVQAVAYTQKDLDQAEAVVTALLKAMGEPVPDHNPGGKCSLCLLIRKQLVAEALTGGSPKN